MSSPRRPNERTALINAGSSEQSQDEKDEAALNKFGYGQELSRTLGFFSMFGFAFKFLSPVVGVYSMFGVGLSTAGPAFIWVLPIIVVGQLLVVFVFSELAVRFPIAGAMYEWGRHLVGPRYGWVVGWVYLWALLITITSGNLGAVPYLLEVAGFSYDQNNLWLPVAVGAGFIVVQLFINLFGVRVTTFLTNAGLMVEIGMTVILGIVLLFVPGPHQDWSIFLSTTTVSGPQSFSSLLPASLAFAFVFYGFEAAAIVSEETKNSRKEVPRSMIIAIIGAGFVTAFLDMALIRGIPSIDVATDPNNVQNVIPYILQAHFGQIIMRILSALLVIAFLSSGVAGQAAAARIIFSYARDDMIPFASYLKTVNPSSQIPIGATIVAGVIPTIVMSANLIAFNSFNMLEVFVSYCVVGVYTSFQMVVFGRIYASCANPSLFADEDVDPQFFSLRSLGIPVAVVAQLYGVSMIINLIWPRAQDGQPFWTAFIPMISSGFVVLLGVIFAFVMVKRADAERDHS